MTRIIGPALEKDHNLYPSWGVLQGGGREEPSARSPARPTVVASSSPATTTATAIPSAAATSSAASRTRLFAVRDGVAFDQWFCDYVRAQNPKPLQSRVQALFPLADGLFWTSLDAISYIYMRFISKHNCEDCWDHLKDQWHGFTLSFLAIISPNMARDRFLEYWANPANQRGPHTVYDYDAFRRQ